MREEEKNVSTEISRMKCGDPDAIAYVYEHYRSCILQYSKKLVTCGTDAEDLTHDVFENAIINCRQLKDNNKFVGWLKGIAVNLSMRKLKTRYQETVLEQTDEEEEVWEIADTHNLENDMIYHELQDKIKNMIDELPKPQKEVLIAYYYYELSTTQIADYLECPLSTVKSRLRSAKRTLKQNNHEIILSWK